MNEVSISEQVEVSELLKNFAKIIKFLRSKLITILIGLIIFASTGIAYSIFKRPVYIAEMTFATENESNSGLGMYASIAAQFGMDIGGASGAFEGDNLIELLKSNTIIRKTLLSKNSNFNELMIERYIITNKMKKKLDEGITTKNINFQQDLTTPHRIEDSILNIVYDIIVKTQLDIIRKDKKLNYVTITMKDKDESFAKNFVELLAKNAIDYYVEYKSRKAKENLILITSKTDSVRNILYGSMQSINQVSDAQLINVVRQTPKFENQKNQVNIQAHTALYAELLKQLGLAQIAAQKQTPLIQIIDKPRLPLEVSKMGKITAAFLFGFLGCILISSYLIVVNWYKESIEIHSNK
jgi:hypothetical protein